MAANSSVTTSGRILRVPRVTVGVLPTPGHADSTGGLETCPRNRRKERRNLLATAKIAPCRARGVRLTEGLVRPPMPTCRFPLPQPRRKRRSPPAVVCDESTDYNRASDGAAQHGVHRGPAHRTDAWVVRA